MQKRCLGNTGIEVSVMGLGTVKFGRNQNVKYPNDFALPSDTAVVSILETAASLGINLVDTAPAYGTSEERLGKALQGLREHWVIMTKVGEEFTAGVSSFTFDATSVQRSIERSLRRLQTDYLDIVLVHSDGNDTQILDQDDVFLTLQQCKQAGKIRAYGMSSKTVAGGLRSVQEADCAMVTLHPAYDADRKVIQAAHELGKGIFIKKAFASGHFVRCSQNPVRDSLQCVFSEPGVTSVIIGTINEKHLLENVQCLQEVVPLVGSVQV